MDTVGVHTLVSVCFLDLSVAILARYIWSSSPEEKTPIPPTFWFMIDRVVIICVILFKGLVMFCFWFSVANHLRADQHTHLTGMFWMVFSFDQSNCGHKDPLLTHVLRGTKRAFSHVAAKITLLPNSIHANAVHAHVSWLIYMMLWHKLYMQYPHQSSPKRQGSGLHSLQASGTTRATSRMFLHQTRLEPQKSMIQLLIKHGCTRAVSSKSNLTSSQSRNITSWHAMQYHISWHVMAFHVMPWNI